MKKTQKEEFKWDISKPWLTLDPWQKDFLNHTGNKVLRSGRQSGKSTIVSIGAGEFAIKNKRKQVMIIAAVERQALLLFEKVLSYLHDNYKDMIKKGKDRPTKHKLQLTNGSTILCLPTGDSGYGIRGHTIDLLIADEAAFIPEEVWTAITPMLAITKGHMWLLSTPFGRHGYFYRCFTDKSFKCFHVSSEDCPRKNQEFLDQEKRRMTKAQYAQEYLGEFVDELRQFFSDELIRKCMKLKRPNIIKPNRSYYLGVDIARMGKDESTFQIIDRTDRNNLRQVENIITKKTLTTQSTKLILQLEERYNFRQIFVDDGGMGVGVFDQLLEENTTKRKVLAINNDAKPLDRTGKLKRKTLKEDIYNNLLMLMERDLISFLDDDEIFLSLKSVQYEYNDAGKFKVFGNYTHIADGLVRAAWCHKSKNLNIWIR